MYYLYMKYILIGEYQPSIWNCWNPDKPKWQAIGMHPIINDSFGVWRDCASYLLRSIGIKNGRDWQCYTLDEELVPARHAGTDPFNLEDGVFVLAFCGCRQRSIQLPWKPLQKHVLEQYIFKIDTRREWLPAGVLQQIEEV